jgi:hypothetical protein
MVGFMGALVRCVTVHHAIIQASSRKDHPEILVIGYPNENCLRDLIAAPSIVGLGFRSREEAMAKLVDGVPAPRALKEKRRPISMSYKAQQDIAASGSGFHKKHRNTCHILQCALASITVFFYSNNLFSLMLRLALGFSS